MWSGQAPRRTLTGLWVGRLIATAQRTLLSARASRSGQSKAQVESSEKGQEPTKAGLASVTGNKTSNFGCGVRRERRCPAAARSAVMSVALRLVVAQSEPLFSLFE